VALSDRQTRSPDHVEEHLPESREEKAAAASGMAFVQAVLEQRAAEACEYAGGDTFRQMRCARRPRIPEGLRLYADGRPRITNVSVRGRTAIVWFADVIPGPVQAIELDRVGKTWRVVGNDSFGLA
jgi:hypothetical protein